MTLFTELINYVGTAIKGQASKIEYLDGHALTFRRRLTHQSTSLYSTTDQCVMICSCGHLCSTHMSDVEESCCNCRPEGTPYLRLRCHLCEIASRKRGLRNDQ